MQQYTMPITGAHLVAIFWQDVYHSGRDPDPVQRVSYIAKGWLAYRGARDLHCLSACDLEASRVGVNFVHKSGGLLDWYCGILAGMVVLIWHWYSSSAGDGSLASMGVTQSTKRVSCGSAPLYLVLCWSACFMDFTHASANPFDCG